MRTVTLIRSVAVVTLSLGLSAQEPGAQGTQGERTAAGKSQAEPGKHVMISSADVNWTPGPPALPAGAQVAVFHGDPSKAGELFTLRAKLPDGYVVPPHWHPTDEHLVILSGTLMVGTGGKFEETSMHALTTGAYTKMPRRMNHYVKAKGETIFQVTAIGPFEVNYVNPQDDPRKKSSTSN